MTIIQQMIAAGIPVIESQSSEAEGKYVFGVLTQAQMDLLPDMIFPSTPTKVEIRKKRREAFGNAKNVVEINRLAVQQAQAWLKNKVHTGQTEANLNALITNATDLKPALIKITRMLYAQREADEKIMGLLLALRDKILPDL